MTELIEPCPFCGFPPSIKSDGETTVFWWVGCADHECKMRHVQTPACENRGDAIAIWNRRGRAGVPQGRCETTLTERFTNPACRCSTYPGNLGPCKTFLPSDGLCVYCNHNEECHAALAATPAPADAIAGVLTELQAATIERLAAECVANFDGAEQRLRDYLQKLRTAPADATIAALKQRIGELGIELCQMRERAEKAEGSPHQAPADAIAAAVEAERK